MIMTGIGCRYRTIHIAMIVKMFDLEFVDSASALTQAENDVAGVAQDICLV